MVGRLRLRPSGYADVLGHARISAILTLWCAQQRSASGVAAAFLPALTFAAFSMRCSFCERSTVFLAPSFGFLDKIASHHGRVVYPFRQMRSTTNDAWSETLVSAS